MKKESNSHMKIKRKFTPSRVNSQIKGSRKVIRLACSRNPEND